MTDERRCPKCGSPFNFTPHQPTFCCGSQDCGGDDHEIMQSDKCRIAELEAEVARLTEQLKTPHPARDFVNESNQLLASKDAEVARLKSELDNMASTFVNTSEYQRGFEAAMQNLKSSLAESVAVATCPACGAGRLRVDDDEIRSPEVVFDCGSNLSQHGLVRGDACIERTKSTSPAKWNPTLGPPNPPKGPKPTEFA